MRVVEISKPGGPDVLQIGERPKPTPGPDEVLIAVKAAGISRADSMQRQGKYPPPPGASDILGLEVAGVLEPTGERVCALLTGGGYAEYAAAPRALTLPIPDTLGFRRSSHVTGKHVHRVRQCFSSRRAAQRREHSGTRRKQRHRHDSHHACTGFRSELHCRHCRQRAKMRCVPRTRCGPCDKLQ